MGLAAEGFARVAVVDDAPDALVALAGPRAEPVPPPPGERPAPHPLSVVSLVRHVARGRGPQPPTLVLTARAITSASSAPLFGYADRGRRTAVVSSSRLRLQREPARAAARVANVAAHERGHLEGLRHCATPGCVMRPARTLEELDARGARTCGRCPRRRPWGAVLAVAALAVVAVAAGMDRLAPALAPAPARPFACRANVDSPGASLLFDGRALDVVGGGGVECAEGSGEVLNALLLQPDPARLEVRDDRAGHAEVVAAGLVVARVATAGPPHGPAPREALALARAFADELQSLLRGKGRADQGCPACHLERPRDMDVARRVGRGGR